MTLPSAPTPDEDDLIERRSYAAGEIVIREGDAGDCFFLVETGMVEIVKATATGRMKLSEVTAGGIFGEMALIDDKPRSATVIALEPTVCRVFRKAILDQSLAASDNLAQALIKLFVKNIRSVTNLQIENRRLLQELISFRDRLADELTVAQRMQLDLLPSPDDIEVLDRDYGIRISSHLAPSSEVGGDLWTVLPLPDDRLGIFVGDLTGHGVVAAVNAFRLHALLGELSGSAGDPGRFLSQLNDRLVALLPHGQFAAAFYALIDPKTETLTYCGAAWESAYVYSPSTRRTVALEGSGLPLGVAQREGYEARTVPFPKGSTFLVYSDALSEVVDRDGIMISAEEFGGWRDLALHQGGNIVTELLTILAERRVRHLDDDLTIVSATLHR